MRVFFIISFLITKYIIVRLFFAGDTSDTPVLAETTADMDVAAKYFSGAVTTRNVQNHFTFCSIGRNEEGVISIQIRHPRRSRHKLFTFDISGFPNPSSLICYFHSQNRFDIIALQKKVSMSISHSHNTPNDSVIF